MHEVSVIGGVWMSCMSLEEVEMTLQEGEGQVKILDVSEGLDASRGSNQGNWKILLKISVLIVKYCIEAAFRKYASS